MAQANKGQFHSSPTGPQSPPWIPSQLKHIFHSLLFASQGAYWAYHKPWLWGRHWGGDPSSEDYGQRFSHETPNVKCVLKVQAWHSWRCSWTTRRVLSITILLAPHWYLFTVPDSDLHSWFSPRAWRIHIIYRTVAPAARYLLLGHK